ncbi:glycogen debranching N-terminal domain-containing protein [Candidatus Acidulodesulfobacterium sp. H_13]|uniref:amylo-alpha-1,6-glucosidase n=1 Tax=Candidatus Acidulodesulfobacterium sp. H_13 TaxID=3395470 RepID=UPI003AF97CF9
MEYKDVITVDDKFYILAASPFINDNIHNLKYGDMFAIFNRYGDIHHYGLRQNGVYYKDTRFLCRYELRFDTFIPLFLSAIERSDNTLLRTNLTNNDIKTEKLVIPRDIIQLSRSKFLFKNGLYEHIKLFNYGQVDVKIPYHLHFDADFADIFEIRGSKRENHGKHLKTVTNDSFVELAYEGLDKIVRKTKIEFSPYPTILSESTAFFDLFLASKEEFDIYITTSFIIEDEQPDIANLSYAAPFRAYKPMESEDRQSHNTLKEEKHRDVKSMYYTSLNSVEEELKKSEDQDCKIYTSNEQFNDWINRSSVDIHMMITHTKYGEYPYAGVPWYSAIFGRDALVTAFEYLWVNPDIAEGVLRTLSYFQAKTISDKQDAEPGKILHEARNGEMASLNEVPFGRYYGSIDSTPLFVMLAGAYHRRTGNTPFIRSIWPNITMAIEWMNKYGDKDQDEFIEYESRSLDGLKQQGWKDSSNSVFYKNGMIAMPSIALSEVQAYAYSAKKEASRLAELLGCSDLSSQMKNESARLKQKFEDAFWCEEISSYALALDGDKKQCKVKTSNAGQCLFSGIVAEEHVDKLAKLLLSKEFFSGWGIRTLSTKEVRYNPMSYHNGSIWPHDNALIAYGLAKYGYKKEVLKILTGFFDASIYFNLHRMPELFCGFDRHLSEAPTLYSVACPVQSWSAASSFMMLQAALGMSIDVLSSTITFNNPVLPESLKWVNLKNLRINDQFVSLHIQRTNMDVTISVVRRSSDIKIVVIK